ncbi:MULTISPECIES: hypothetical protein [Vibrio]|uniref:hypothetical protein n=1 Tax=Vibrio TaxID=662 RepID=UPI002964503E|nr:MULTISPECIES: hypothetical protein [unclassified Vibrio]MDW1637141.1 hypothetical protein [Vibrio sp. Vb2907]MDW1707903.1 hypothetical protein [Vibrio sp. Vb2917]MDW1722452.1 hypothetical protein [Vibrio sp. Vb2979]
MTQVVRSLCKHCAAVLNIDFRNKPANRCSECQGWQNSRSFLDMSNLVLTGIVSFITISLAFWKPIHELVADKVPKINLSVLTTDYRQMSFFVSNTGKAPAGIVEMYVVIDEGKPMNIPVGKKYWGTLLDKDEANAFKVSHETSGLPIQANPDHFIYKKEHVINCIFVLTYKELGSKTNKDIKYDYPCYNFSPLPKGLKRKMFDSLV